MQTTKNDKANGEREALGGPKGVAVVAAAAVVVACEVAVVVVVAAAAVVAAVVVVVVAGGPVYVAAMDGLHSRVVSTAASPFV